ncbi:MAG TPA: hypothetical protein PKK12_11780 [Candidatus Aminicenantes bacterium]|nr:hypothetical protein [Candidatus Aminicenantes bacterium]
MKRWMFCLILGGWALCGLVCAGGVPAAEADEQTLYSKAKMGLFDKQWQESLGLLQRLEREFPDSAALPAYVFYQAKCLAGLDRKAQALAAFERYVGLSGNAELAEEAEREIIDLAFALTQAGDRGMAGRVLGRLSHANRVVSYYAAIKASYFADKGLVARAIPLLRRIADSQADEELRDRARLALLRIDPKLVKSANAAAAPSSAMRMLRIKIVDKKSRTDSFSLAFPLGLAETALRSLDQEARRAIGRDPQQLLAELLKKPQTVFQFDAEESSIRIWIE